MILLFLFRKSIAAWWREFRKSPLERYLEQSVDLCDLEYRLRQLGRGGL